MPEPIFEPGPVDTPFVYTVSGTGEVVPRACQAVYDGSGAGGDYIPAVIFRSQAGHVISRAILQSTVTAGDDAEVSWFPGVKHAAAATATVTPMYAARSTEGGIFLTSVPTATDTAIKFVDSKFTNDLAQTYYAPNGTTAITVRFPGTYLVLWWVLFASQGSYQTRCGLSSDQGSGSNFHRYAWGDGFPLAATSFAASAMPSNPSYTHAGVDFVECGSPPTNLGITAWQNSGGSINATACGMSLIRQGNDLTFRP